MATLIGTLVGGAIGGPPGAAIGGAIGSFLDSEFVFPFLFPQDDLVGPRLDRRPVMNASEGSPMHWPLGPRVPLSGTVIWKPERITVQKTRRIGGGIFRKGQKVTTFRYFQDFAISFCDTRGLPGNKINRIVKIFAGAKLIYDGVNDFGDLYGNLTVYDGSQTTLDPVIVSYDGEDNTVPFKDTCYVLINGLDLADWNGAIPSIRAIVEQQNSFMVQEAISLIMQKAGYATGEFDVSRLPQCMNGYNISGPQKMNRALAPLAMAHSVNVQEKDAKVHFIPKGTEDQLVVKSADDFAAHDPGEEVQRPFETIDKDDFDLPSEVTVRFNDTTRQLEPGSRTARRWDHVAQNKVSLDLPISMTPSEAMNIAHRLLWAADAERRRPTVMLPPSYIGLREGMALLLPDVGGRSREMWVRRVAIGNNYQVEAQGTFYQRDTYTQDHEVDDTFIDPSVYVPPALTTVIADMPNFNADTEGEVGLVHAAAITDPALRWRGAQLWRSSNNVDFVEEDSIVAEAVIGTVTDGLLLANVQSHRWDRGSSMTVTVIQGGLATASESDVLDGANRAAIQTAPGEYEIIGFANAVLIDTRTYQISTLLRGLRGTEHLIDKHVLLNKRFILLDGNTLNFVARNFLDNSYWKVPPIGAALSSVESERVLVEGISVRSFSPWQLTGSYALHVPSGEWRDLTISWQRRMKYPRGLFSGKAVPPDETPETYKVDIILGNHPTFGRIMRTFTVTEATSVVYTWAQQLVDIDPISFRPMSQVAVAAAVYQITHWVGPSPPKFEIFFRPGS